VILLDTNVVSEIMRPSPERRLAAWLDAQPTGTLHVCAITRAEIELGIAQLPEGRRKRALRSGCGDVCRRFRRVLPAV
jgi:predicted nucleic acid-binding protein